MRGRAFLDLAREVVLGKTEAHWRAAVIHSYYAVLLEGREALARWGRLVPPRDSVHTFVRFTLSFATDADVKAIGTVIETLVKLRNKANYNLQPLSFFSTDLVARDSIQDATTALALLDAVEADPARRAAAISSLPPP